MAIPLGTDLNLLLEGVEPKEGVWLEENSGIESFVKLNNCGVGGASGNSPGRPLWFCVGRRGAWEF